jgi:AraC family transcriptional regulator
MDPNPPLAPPRIQQAGALLIFGLNQRYKGGDMSGIPAQWERFVPHLGRIPEQVGHVSYGVVHNSDNAGNTDYLCGVEVSEFPSDPPEFFRLRIPPQTYAIFEHKDHISSIGATWTHIWQHALADAGYATTGGPALERYDENFDGRTGLGGLQLWVPIQP